MHEAVVPVDPPMTDLYILLAQVLGDTDSLSLMSRMPSFLFLCTPAHNVCHMHLTNLIHSELTNGLIFFFRKEKKKHITLGSEK